MIIIRKNSVVLYIKDTIQVPFSGATGNAWRQICGQMTNSLCEQDSGALSEQGSGALCEHDPGALPEQGLKTSGSQ